MPSTEAPPSRIGDYVVFPISLPPIHSFSQPATHYIYLHPHEPKSPDPKASRSLFLVNVPFDSTMDHMKTLLSLQISLPAGRIEDVVFDGQKQQLPKETTLSSAVGESTQKDKKRKRAHERIDLESVPGTELPTAWDQELRLNGLNTVVVFVDKTGMEAALKAIRQKSKSKERPVWGEGVEEASKKLGYTRYMHHEELRFPDEQQLLRSVDKYMTAFAAKEAFEAAEQVRQRSEPDEDGFVTVGRGGRDNPARQGVAQRAAEKQQAKQQGLKDFYRFQSREERKAQAKALIKQFESDQERVRTMKQQRQNFRPK